MIEYAIEMTTTEEKPMTVKMIDLQEGEALDSADVTHIPPSGTPLAIAPTVQDSVYITMLFGPFSAIGTHHVKVQGEGSLGSKPEVLYTILIKV